jgi:hypothetical protein
MRRRNQIWFLLWPAVAIAAFIFLSRAAFAQPKPQPVDPARANADAREGTRNLDNKISDVHNQLQAQANRVNDLKKQSKDAKNKADAAAKAAEKARDAAADCKEEKDKKKIQGLIDDAEKKLKEANDAKDKADATEKDIRDKVDKAVGSVDDQIKSLNNTIEKGLSAAKAAGLKGNSVPVGNLNDAQKMLNDKVSKLNDDGTKEKNFTDQGALSKLREEANRFNPEIRKAKEGQDPSDSLDKAKEFIKAAKKYLDNCPPPKEQSMVPSETPHMVAEVNNKSSSLACIPSGQNVDGPATTLNGGSGNYNVVATGPNGTIVQLGASPSEVNRLAKDNNITLCFPAEENFCVIMTPLTPERSAYVGPRPITIHLKDARR